MSNAALPAGEAGRSEAVAGETWVSGPTCAAFRIAPAGR
jgi:hypothetical protein